MIMRDKAKKDVRHCNNMRVASDDKTQLCINMDLQHLSTTRSSSCCSKTKLMHYVKYPLVVVPKEQVTTIDRQEIHFLQYFRQKQGVLPGLYSLGVDVDGYLIMGIIDHKESEALTTMMNLQDMLTIFLILLQWTNCWKKKTFSPQRLLAKSWRRPFASTK